MPGLIHRREVWFAETSGLVIGSLHHEVIDDVTGFVDVMDGPIPKASNGRIVFLTCDVFVGSIQQLHGAVEAAGAIHPGIDRGMIVQVLAIPNRGPFDFVDGPVDLFDGMLFFFVHVIVGGKILQMGARMTQVGERVQISRMSARFFGHGKSGAGGNKKHDYGAMS